MGPRRQVPRFGWCLVVQLTDCARLISIPVLRRSLRFMAWKRGTISSCSLLLRKPLDEAIP